MSEEVAVGKLLLQQHIINPCPPRTLTHLRFHNTVGLHEVPVSISAGQHKQISNQPPYVSSVYKCHARGQLVRMRAESPEELTESPSPQSLIRRVCVDTKRGSSLSPYHQVCCASFKCI